MTTAPLEPRPERGAPDVLPPYPRGWYGVAFESELPRGTQITRKLGGRELVLFRGESGVVGALDPVCPHLGAHMGHGGTVVGDSLRCPFHGFRFGTDGGCVATGYGTKPPRTSARTWSVRASHGIVLVWLDPAGGPPTFDVPAVDLSSHGPLRTRTYRLRSHPQDTTENSVDFGHLGVVHGYENVRQLGALELEGPYLGARYAMHRPVGLFGKLFGGVDAEFQVHVHGLGYSHVDVVVPSLGIQTHNFVLATPAGDRELELRIALTMRRLLAAPRVPEVLRRLPLGLLEEQLVARAFDAFAHDVEQDFVIWNHKEYVPRPALAQGDGPVMRYRRWAEQFYPS